MQAVQLKDVNPGQECVIHMSDDDSMWMEICVRTNNRLLVSCANGEYIDIDEDKFVIVEDFYTKSEWESMQE